ncbi:MAG: hypothetical protein KDB07_07010, partial [Planctomycetes bacterium]|nr:hypothetical protein [Planctomycetota bacterium]
MDRWGSLFFANSNRVRRIDGRTKLVETYAGGNGTGSAGAGGSSIFAQLNNVSGLACAPDGTLYISESGNHVVRAIHAAHMHFDPTQGYINTLVGDGSYDAAGDGGPYHHADLASSDGLVIDRKFGVAYISDAGRHVVRKVDLKTGFITTFAGQDSMSGNTGDSGPATSALLNTPTHLGISADHKLLICDTQNNRVRAVDLVTGIITNFAGNAAGSNGYTGDNGPATSATLFSPNGIAVLQNGDVFISDTNNHAIRKVQFGSGTITTVAGGNSAGYTGDYGSALSAQLDTPLGLDIDGAGWIYVAEFNNHVIRRIDTVNDYVETIAGTGSSGGVTPGDPLSSTLSMPTDVAISLDGKILVSTNGNRQILRISSDLSDLDIIAGTGTNATTGDLGAASASTLYLPNCLDVDAYGSIWVGQDDGHVRGINPANRFLYTGYGDGNWVAASGDDWGTGGYPGANMDETALFTGAPKHVLVTSTPAQPVTLVIGTDTTIELDAAATFDVAKIYFSADATLRFRASSGTPTLNLYHLGVSPGVGRLVIESGVDFYCVGGDAFNFDTIAHLENNSEITFDTDSDDCYLYPGNHDFGNIFLYSAGHVHVYGDFTTTTGTIDADSLAMSWIFYGDVDFSMMSVAIGMDAHFVSSGTQTVTMGGSEQWGFLSFENGATTVDCTVVGSVSTDSLSIDTGVKVSSASDWSIGSDVSADYLDIYGELALTGGSAQHVVGASVWIQGNGTNYDGLWTISSSHYVANTSYALVIAGEIVLDGDASFQCLSGGIKVDSSLFSGVGAMLFDVTTGGANNIVTMGPTEIFSDWSIEGESTTKAPTMTFFGDFILKSGVDFTADINAEKVQLFGDQAAANFDGTATMTFYKLRTTGDLDITNLGTWTNNGTLLVSGSVSQFIAGGNFHDYGSVDVSNTTSQVSFSDDFYSSGTLTIAAGA